MKKLPFLFSWYLEVNIEVSKYKQKQRNENNIKKQRKKVQ